MAVYQGAPPTAGNYVMLGVYNHLTGEFVAPRAGTVYTDGISNEKSAAMVVAMDVNQQINAMGSTDGGTTLKNLKVLTDGTVVTNATLAASTNAIGITYSYREAVALGLIGTKKTFIASATLNNSGGAAETFTNWVDSGGTSQGAGAGYTVPNGKTFYIWGVHVSLDTNASGALQSADMTLTDGTNSFHSWVGASGASYISFPQGKSLASGKLLTATATASNLATAAGKVYIVVDGTEV